MEQNYSKEIYEIWLCFVRLFSFPEIAINAVSVDTVSEIQPEVFGQVTEGGPDKKGWKFASETRDKHHALNHSCCVTYLGSPDGSSTLAPLSQLFQDISNSRAFQC